MIDETGKKYGYLTVIKRGPNSKSGKAQWLCNCDCGKENVLILGSQLRSGKTKSCGCYQKEQTIKASINDLTGQTIGNFLVLKSVGPGVGGHTWQCKCLLCGNKDVFITTPNLYKQYSCGCSIKSKGERKIKTLLEENKINFIQEKRFSNCKFEDTNSVARFDFYLPDFNCVIEYDGRQHFIKGNGIYDNDEKYEKTQIHDSIKNKYCSDNNIYLIRIPFMHFDNIIIDDLLPATSRFLLSPNF